MSCNDFAEQINLLMDGELEEPRHPALYAHLESCADCRALMGGLLRVRQILQKDRPPFPEMLDAKILPGIVELEPSIRRQSGGLMRVPLPWALAAIVILAAVAFFLGRSSKPAVPEQAGESRAALVSTSPRIEPVYALPGIEVVKYASQIQKADSGTKR
jgi:anti-sigma factor RsiW